MDSRVDTLNVRGACRRSPQMLRAFQMHTVSGVSSFPLQSTLCSEHRRIAKDGTLLKVAIASPFAIPIVPPQSSRSSDGKVLMSNILFTVVER